MPKLIESDFPFSRLSLIAERESWRKEIYRPVYYLHKWWARRLGSVFRGIVLGACLDDSEDFWQYFYSKNCFEETIVFDPFMGSGVTIGEAIKLGCRAVGRDINQVAWLSCSAALSMYSRFDVLRAYERLEESLAPRLLRYYRTTTDTGDDATVLYFFLVKVVTCPSCGGEVELFKTRIFSRNAIPRKDPSARSICPGCGAVHLTIFDAESACCPECGVSYNPQNGNIKGSTVNCNHCHRAFRLVDRMRSMDGPLGFRRYAKLLLTSDGRKIYARLNDGDRAIERQVKAEYASIIDSFPIVSISSGYNTDQMLKHNYRYWHEVLSDRQLVCVRHMIDAIKEIDQDDLRLLFACLFSGTLEFNNLFTSFKGEGTGAVRHMFAHHVLKPEIMPLEANIWGTSKSSGAFSSLFHSRVERALEYKSNPFELRINGSHSAKVRGINKPMEIPIAKNFQQFEFNPRTAYLSTGDSSCIDLPDNSIDLIVTDPPFFDNVHYSQLADFFYYWLSQIVKELPNTTTRSPNEVQDTDSGLFTKKLTSVFAECRRVLRSGGLFIFTYHHARHEGWTSVHRAIRHAGFACIQAYPIKAEMSVSMPLQQAKSPIHLDLILVCREDSQSNRQSGAAAGVSYALSAAKDQINSLIATGIKISLGDAKVVLMGRLLCEAHKIRNLKQEERFLQGLEQDIDSYVNEVIATQGDILYEQVAHEPVQLMLFEEIGNYWLANDPETLKNNA